MMFVFFHIQFSFTFFPLLLGRMKSFSAVLPLFELSVFLVLHKVWRKTLCFQQGSVQQRLPADQTTTWVYVPEVLMLRLRSPCAVLRLSVYKSRIIQMINHKLEVLFTQLFTI